MISRAEQHGDCTFAVVSDTGISHRIHNIVNQDAVDYIVIGDDFALAVSDGVGSCQRAEIGSNAAVSAIKSVFNSLMNKAVQNEPSRIADCIITEWHRLLGEENPDDCCATLKAAIKIGNRLLLFSIGDGILAVSSAGMRVCAPLENNLFTNQTKCLNEMVKSEDIWLSIFNLDLHVPYVVFACTDGVANGILEGCEMELVEEIENELDATELQSELENLLIDIAEYSSDDRTVGVVKYERKNAKHDR